MDYNDIIKQIEKTDSNFGSVIDDAQKRMLREVLTLTKDLALSNGRILPTVGNLKLISQIKNKLNKAVLSKDYLSGVKDLLKSFEAIQTNQITAFKDLSSGLNTKAKYDLVRGMAIENTANQLTESGIDANVTSKLKDMLLRSVTSGGLYSDLVGEVSEFLSNTDKSPGALSRYAKTYTTTALNQFAGQTNKLITESSKTEWFRYVGSDIETTREWCDLMTDKEYIHISEFDDVLKGKIDGKQCEIYDKTKLPKGMIEGTNVNNLQINCGGWNCRHALVPVLEFTVPKNLRDKIGGEFKISGDKEFLKEINAIKNKNNTPEKLLEDKEIQNQLSKGYDLADRKRVISDYLAKTGNYKTDTYYRYEGAGEGYAGAGNGLYLGRDKKALNNFYNEYGERGLKISEFKGKPNFLDITDPRVNNKWELFLKQNNIKQLNSDDIQKVVSKLGFDGLKYYDVNATGVEYVVFNTKLLTQIK